MSKSVSSKYSKLPLQAKVGLLAGTFVEAGLAMALLSSCANQAMAQAALPPVTVDAPRQTKAVTRKIVARPASTQAPVVRVARKRNARAAAAPPPPKPVRSPTAPPAPNVPPALVNPAVGPIDGYVARTSATGTKTATPLIETPQSITVVGSQQIRDLNERTIGEALTYASGVRADTFGADTRNDFLLIRGFPAQITGYYLDGLQLPSPGFGTFKIEPYGLERLEVLKGPASVLYGGSSTGGIINGVSKRPTQQQQGSIEVGINNYGNAYAAFDVSGPVSQKPDNQFYYRLVGLAHGGDTQVNYTNDDRLYVAPSLTWAPDAQTSITFLGSYQKDSTKGENFLPYFGTVQSLSFGKIPTSLFTDDPGLGVFKRNQALIGYTAEHKFNEIFTVRQNLRYADLRIDDRTLYGGGYVGDPNNANLGRFNFVAEPHVAEFAVDNQLEARFRTGPLGHTVLFGVDYKHYADSDAENFTYNPAGYALNLLRPAYFTGATASTNPFAGFRDVQDQVAEYLQDQIKFDRFTLVLSGRHDGLSTSFTNRLTPANSASSTDSAFTGRVGLIYTTDMGLAPYATYATSFDPQLGQNGATQKALVPETGQLTEVGVKYQPIGTNISFDAALFNLVENNVPTTDPTNFLNTIQTGQERSRGFEIGANASLADGLKLLFAYTGYQLLDLRDANPLYVGKTPTNIPQNFGALYLDYTIQDGVLKGLGAGAGPRYVGGSYAAPDDSAGVPAYVLADAGIHYDREHWRAALNVRNVFDKTYVASCSSVTACFYGQRRTALFSLAYKW